VPEGPDDNRILARVLAQVLARFGTGIRIGIRNLILNARWHQPYIRGQKHPDKPTMKFFDQLKFNADGLIPAIIQEQGSGRVVMMAWMNRASIEKTIETGKTWFWSRSRQKYWMKGESSGHVQVVKDIAFDCDGDTLLIQVEQTGAACHEGYRSCFFRSITSGGQDFKITEPLLESPEKIYGKK
jgi:phosphoribosyl-AMP cyclohydrolase